MPCYEVTVKTYPSLLEKFFGHRQQELKCVSDIGLEWYTLPLFQRIAFNSPLDKVLIEITTEKRRGFIQKLFNSIREIKVKAYTEEQQKMN